jgi:succinate dehydrogenase / fumarate reductase cytochrome b subunit
MSSFLDPPAKPPRPEFRNLHITQILRYRLPPAGLVSIMHRASGALLFLTLPLTLWLFQTSLASEHSFDRLHAFASHPLARLLLLVLLWGFFHHLVAGIRYLALDLHLGITRQASRRSALAVYAVSLPLTLVTALRLLGVF